jgi:hypothetical protein
MWVWINTYYEHPFTSYFDVHQRYKVLTHCQINLVGSNRLVQYSLQYPINQEIGASPSHHIRAMGTTTGAPLAIRSEKRQKIETSVVRSILLMGKSCQISILAG